MRKKCEENFKGENKQGIQFHFDWENIILNDLTYRA